MRDSDSLNVSQDPRLPLRFQENGQLKGPRSGSISDRAGNKVLDCGIFGPDADRYDKVSRTSPSVSAIEAATRAFAL